MKIYKEDDNRDINVINECKNTTVSELDEEFEKFKKKFIKKRTNYDFDRMTEQLHTMNISFN